MFKKLLMIMAAIGLLSLGYTSSAYAAVVTSTALTAGGTSSVTILGSAVNVSLSTNVSGSYSLDDGTQTTRAKVITVNTTGTRYYGLDSNGGGSVAATKDGSATVAITVPAATAAWAGTYTAANASTN